MLTYCANNLHQQTVLFDHHEDISQTRAEINGIQRGILKNFLGTPISVIGIITEAKGTNSAKIPLLISERRRKICQYLFIAH